MDVQTVSFFMIRDSRQQAKKLKLPDYATLCVHFHFFALPSHKTQVDFLFLDEVITRSLSRCSLKKCSSPWRSTIKHTHFPSQKNRYFGLWTIFFCPLRVFFFKERWKCAARFSRETVKNKSSAQGIIKFAVGRDPKIKTVNWLSDKISPPSLSLSQ